MLVKAKYLFNGKCYEMSGRRDSGKGDDNSGRLAFFDIVGLIFLVVRDQHVRVPTH